MYIRIAYILLASLYINVCCGQITELRKLSFIPTNSFTAEFPDTLSFFEFQITDDLVFDEDERAQIVKSEVTFLFDKNDLLEVLECEYDFPEFDPTRAINGKAIVYTLAEPFNSFQSTLVYIDVDYVSTHHYFLWTDVGLYSLDAEEGKSLFCSGFSVFFESELSKTNITFLEKDTSDILEETWTFDWRVSEQLALRKEGYKEYIITPAEFENHIIEIESISEYCQEAVLDTTVELIKIKDAFTEIEIVPPTFETVTEQILESSAYWNYDITEAQFTSGFNTFILSNNHLTIDTAELIIPCYDGKYDFYRCTDYELIQLPQVDTTLNFLIPYCENESGDLFGKHCYRRTDYPAQYTTRTYERLVGLGGYNEEIVSEEYKEYLMVTASNQNSLPQGCLSFKKDTFNYKKLVNDAQVDDKLIDAEYEEISALIFEPSSDLPQVIDNNNISVFEVIEFTDAQPSLNQKVVCSDFVMVLFEEDLRNILIDRGYLQTNNSNSVDELMNAILLFQLENKLPLGNIDAYLLDALNIRY